MSNWMSSSLMPAATRRGRDTQAGPTARSDPWLPAGWEELLTSATPSGTPPPGRQLDVPPGVSGLRESTTHSIEWPDYRNMRLCVRLLPDHGHLADRIWAEEAVRRTACFRGR